MKIALTLNQFWGGLMSASFCVRQRHNFQEIS